MGENLERLSGDSLMSTKTSTIYKLFAVVEISFMAFWTVMTYLCITLFTLTGLWLAVCSALMLAFDYVAFKRCIRGYRRSKAMEMWNT